MAGKLDLNVSGGGGGDMKDMGLTVEDTKERPLWRRNNFFVKHLSRASMKKTDVKIVID